MAKPSKISEPKVKMQKFPQNIPTLISNLKKSAGVKGSGVLPIEVPQRAVSRKIVLNKLFQIN